MRVDAAVSATYAVMASAAPEAASSTDVSGGGVRLAVPRWIAPKTPLVISMMLPGREPSIRFVGEVVWCAEATIGETTRAEIGVQILKIDPADHAALAQFVEQRIKR